MILAVASGKGGTGKTTVAVSLALALADGDEPPVGSNERPLLVDCDVEEPNAGLFLEHIVDETRDVVLPLPRIDAERCDACGRCAEVCAFQAIAVVGGQVLVFPELCHGCGSCTLSCPTQAISEVDRVQGVLERGPAGPVDLAQGRLDVGEAMPVPAIHQLKRWVLPRVPLAGAGRPIIIDAPPGTSCPVVETVRGVDAVLLVTEPTPFGAHDLRLAVEVVRDELGIPVGVLLNRDGTGYHGVEQYCSQAGVPILMRIPHDRRIAEAYSDGAPLVEARPEYRAPLRELYTSLLDLRSSGVSAARQGGVGR